MRTTFKLALCLVTVSLTHCGAASAKIVAKIPNSALSKNALSNWAKTQQARQSYGLYMMGRKVGYMTMNFDIQRQRDARGAWRDVAVSSSEAVLRLRSADPKSAPDMEMKQSSTFALSGDGALLAGQQRTLENGRPTTYRLILPAKSNTKTAQLETFSGGKRVLRTVDAPRENLEQSRRMMNWLRSQPKSGATFSYLSTSLDGNGINESETMIFQHQKMLAWGGLKVPIYAVRMSSKGVDFDADLRANGMFVSGKIAGIIDVRAEENAIARDMSQAGVDLLAASLIKVDKRLGDPRELQTLTLGVSGVTLEIPQSKRQKIVKVNGQTRLQLRAEAPGNFPQVLAAAQRRKFIASTTSIQSDESSIRQLAARILAQPIVGGPSTLPADADATLRKSEKLARWVYFNLGKSMSANSSTALQILATKKGDCTEHALLFTTLARAAGIPAREVTGLAYVETPAPTFGWHAWAEVHNGREWISVDPTWNEVRIDASHIKFADDEDDFRWTRAMGKLKLNVVGLE